MKRQIAVISSLVAACGMVACGPGSELGPDDQVTVEGRALSQAGAPLQSTRVVLVKEPDVGEILVGFTALVGSFGLICLSEDPPALCDSAHSATTDAQGGFAISLLGRDKQGSVGQASPLNLAVRGPAREGAVTGPSRTERFIIQKTQIDAPDLTLWDPVVAVAVAESGVTVSSPALPAQTTGRVSFVVPGAELWSQAYVSGGEVDGRFLEDATGTVSIHATGSDEEDGTEFEHRYESETRSFVSTTGAPPSREAVCTGTGASGVEVAVNPCALTDGNFVQPYVPPADTGCVGEGCETARANRTVTVDLGDVVQATLVVVRGLGSEDLVERSTDGTNWNAMEVDQGFTSFILPTGIRYIRARSETAGSGFSTSLREISVW